MENPPKDFYRLAPGREVRLRYAYFLKCREVIKDAASGKVTELRCTYDPETAGGQAADGRKVKGTIHWVSATHAANVDVRLYDVMFTQEHPEDVPAGVDWRTLFNPNSLEVVKDCKVEPALAQVAPGDRVQFERIGYFFVDPIDSRPKQPVFNRTVTLKDRWAKIKSAQ
jgi:glutaminyl-tRNA synthetase